MASDLFIQISALSAFECRVVDYIGVNGYGESIGSIPEKALETRRLDSRIRCRYVNYSNPNSREIVTRTTDAWLASVSFLIFSRRLLAVAI